MRFPVFLQYLFLTLSLIGTPFPVYAQTEQDVRLVLQITVDGLRADLLHRY